MEDKINKNKEETQEDNTEKFNSIIEILKGVEYREITNILNAVETYVESRKKLNCLT